MWYIAQSIREAIRALQLTYSIRYIALIRLSNTPRQTSSITFASVTSHSRAQLESARMASRDVLKENRTSTHGARMGPVRRRTNFASLYGARRVLMHALYAYGPRTGLEIVNSPWTAPAGPTRGPYGPRMGVCATGPVREFCQFWLGHFPYGARTMPVRAPHGVPMEPW